MGPWGGASGVRAASCVHQKRLRPAQGSAAAQMRGPFPRWTLVADSHLQKDAFSAANVGCFPCPEKAQRILLRGHGQKICRQAEQTGNDQTMTSSSTRKSIHHLP